MNYIFFDLETTDSHSTGQILEYAFVHTDGDMNPISTLEGTITLGRTQIPSPMAILVTGIDIKDHLSNEESFEEKYEPWVIGSSSVDQNILKNFNEKDSMNIISDWIRNICEKHPTIILGHNTNKFDVPFLRTSMIRNGISPYFPVNDYADTRNMLRFLCCQEPSVLEKLKSGGDRTFSLENACRVFGIIDDNTVQSHRAMDDVIIMIQLCIKLKRLYGIDPHTVNNLKHLFKTPSLNNKIIPAKVLNYDDNGEVSIVSTDLMVYGIYNKKYYLFMEKDKTFKLSEQIEDDSISFDESKKLLKWCKSDGDFFFLEYDLARKPDSESDRLLKYKRKIQDLHNISIDNFFPDKICDIEKHIYLMNFKGLNELEKAIKNNTSKNITNNYAKSLYTRYKYNIQDIDTSNEHFIKNFKQYLDYRYGISTGKTSMILNSWKSDKNDLLPEDYHQSIYEYKNSLIELIESEKSKNHKTEHLNSLLSYINSYIDVYG